MRYITVTPVTNFFKPATRAFGNLAIIGDATGNGPAGVPVEITNPGEVQSPSHVDGSGDPIVGPVDSQEWFEGSLGAAVRVAFQQSPGPSKVVALRADPTDGTQLTDAFTAISTLDVQIVVLANTPLTDTDGTTEIEALAGHVNTVSNSGGDGKERIGVAMLGAGTTDTALVTGAMSIDRMTLVAHHSDEDAAAAYAGCIAGYPPHISLLLKPVVLSMDQQFTDSQISAFDDARVNWITDPLLIPGKSLMMGESYTLGADKPYVDIVRVIDDISFRLKAMLIRSIGNLRISRPGLRVMESRISGVLQPLVQNEVIVRFDVFTPLLTILDKAPEERSAVEAQQLTDARNARAVNSLISVVYAGAIHRLNLTLNFV
ncbi:hypothetical protein [Marinibacterium sp. SX1]|uniref:hypothetical protein n=1 Tax=Marinibacterium sp. SX1 TaxID=3388424 RepID=UPI003D16C29D